MLAGRRTDLVKTNPHYYARDMLSPLPFWETCSDAQEHNRKA